MDYQMANNLTIEIAVQGGQAARQALNQIARSVREAADQANAGAAHAAGGWKQLTEAFGRTREGLRVVREGFGEVHKAVGELRNAMNEMIERTAPNLKEAFALTAAAAAAGFVEAAKSAAESVHQLKNAGETFGTTTQGMQQIKFGQGLAGVTDEQNTMLARFTKNWGDVTIALKQGGAAAAEARKRLAELGLSGAGTAGKIWTAEGGSGQTLEILQKVAEALSRMDDPLKRNALSMQWFGRNYAEIAPFINHFMELMKQAGKILDDYHLRIGSEEIEASHKFMTSFTTMSNVLGREKEALGNIFGTALEPAFVELYDTVGRNTESIMKWGEQLRDRLMPIVHDFITLLHVATGEVEGFDPSRDLHTDLVQQFYSAWQQVKGILVQVRDAFAAMGKAMVTVLDGVAKVINDVFGTTFTAQGLAAIVIIGQMIGAWKLLATAIAVATAARNAFFLKGPIGAAAAAAGAVTVGAIAGVNKAQHEQGDALAKEGTSIPELISRYSGGAMGMAAGGSVHGPSGTDRIPAWLSLGEFVVNAKAVAKYGREMFAAYNSLQIPRFASGGYVDSFGDPVGYTEPSTGAGAGSFLGVGISPGLSGNADLADTALAEGHGKDSGPFKSSFYSRAQGVQDAMIRGLSNIIGRGAVQSLTEGILPPGISAKMLSLTQTAGRTGAGQYALNLSIDGKTFHLQADQDNAQAIVNFTRLRRLVSAGRLPSSASS
jgi:hypothetical protein